jgi:hypothetical protein
VKVNHDFLEGGYIDDYQARGKWQLRDDTRIDATVQYEHWGFPILALRQQTNITASVGVVFTPKWLKRRDQ